MIIIIIIKCISKIFKVSTKKENIVSNSQKIKKIYSEMQ
jgi:hypothetical protein